MYKSYSLLFIFAISLSLHAELKIEAKTGRRNLYVWQKTYLQIKIEDDANMLYNAGYIDTSLINDFTIENISVDSSSSEGENKLKSSRIVKYTLRPNRTGVCLIPALTVPYYGEIQNSEAKIGSISFNVKDKNDFFKKMIIIFIPIFFILLFAFFIIVKIYSIKKTKI